VNDVPGVERIRFASPHPRHTGERLIAAVRDLPKVCKHMHLPVQSGSTRVLAAMRRRHTRDEYLDLVARLRAEIPGNYLGRTFESVLNSAKALLHLRPGKNGKA